MTEMLTNRHFGGRIVASRIKRKLSQLAVAQRAGIDASYLSRIETGKVKPRLETALRIAESLHMTLDDLVGPSPAQRKNRPCPVSPNGQCMMDLIDVGAEVGDARVPARFSPRQIRLLRRFTALVQRGNPRRLRALEMLITEILEERSIP